MGPDPDAVQAARQAGLGLLAACDRTVCELRDRLLERFAAEVVEQVVADFQRLRLLDDERVGRRWVESRLARRPAAPARLASELEARGVDPDLVARLLAERAEELDPAVAAVALLRQQRRRYAGLDREAARRRMFGLLARRGYEHEVALRAVEQAWKEMQDDVARD